MLPSLSDCLPLQILIQIQAFMLFENIAHCAMNNYFARKVELNAERNKFCLLKTQWNTLFQSNTRSQPGAEKNDQEVVPLTFMADT